MRLLVLGGSGFVSQYVVREAARQGYEVWYVTRGNREGIPGAHRLIADRNDRDTLRAALRTAPGRFDGVIDCICFNPEQARVDLEVLPEFTDHVIVLSTDSLYHPEGKRIPQNEEAARYLDDGSYGAMKRKMEETFLTECPGNLRFTLFRPPHMFGAGSELGCFPVHTRQKDLLAHLRAGKPIRLVGGGEYLIQPLYAGDMARAAVAAVSNPAAYNQIFCIAGPEVMPNRDYFTTLGKLLGLPVTIESVDEEVYNRTHTDGCFYFLPRAYDLSKLRNAGLPVPETKLEDGLREQVEWLIAQGR